LQVVSNTAFVTCITQIQVAACVMQGFQQPLITSSYAYVLVYGYSDIQLCMAISTPNSEFRFDSHL